MCSLLSLNWLQLLSYLVTAQKQTKSTSQKYIVLFWFCCLFFDFSFLNLFVELVSVFSESYAILQIETQY